jgi:hypothetical protein
MTGHLRSFHASAALSSGGATIAVLVLGLSAAIAAMRERERAIQTKLPRFVLEFLKKDPNAQVQVEWKRRTVGSAQGRGGPTCWRDVNRYRSSVAVRITRRPVSGGRSTR